MKYDLSGRSQAAPSSSVDPTGIRGAEMVLQSCPTLGQMVDLYALASVTHWIRAASRRTWPWASRLSVAETKPGGADSIASSWSNKSYY